MLLRFAPRQTVDRLIRIAGDSQVGIIDRHRAHDGVLGQIGVLIFVDENVAITLIEAAADFRIFTQQHGDVQQQVVEIDGAAFEQPLLIGRINSGHDVAPAGCRGAARIARARSDCFWPN